MTARQLAEILETPLGRLEEYSDVEVVAARRLIVRYYNDLKNEMAYSAASLNARARWIQENICATAMP